MKLINDYLTELHEGASSSQQTEVDALCETIGIDTIHLTFPEWNKQKALTLITILREKANIYVVDVEKEILDSN